MEFPFSVTLRTVSGLPLRIIHRGTVSISESPRFNEALPEWIDRKILNAESQSV